jgi:3-methyladenine DNA glycosylase/8-oxoguanine DNA glycosylase
VTDGPSPAIAEKWRPYRSLATSYLFSAAFEPAEAPATPSA